jgi:hypothetical protein
MRLPPGHTARTLSLQGTLDDQEGVRRALAFIQHGFHPSARIIIYGYSAGGLNALDLARLIQSESTYYGFSSRRFYEVFRMEGRMSRETLGAVRVDLLITVDAASGPTSLVVNRTVPACVRRNLNFYQTIASRIGSRGWPNRAVSSSSTVIENVDLTGQATHASMDEYTNARVLDAIQGVLGREATPSLIRGGAATASADRPLSTRSRTESTGAGWAGGVSPSQRRGMG